MVCCVNSLLHTLVFRPFSVVLWLIRLPFFLWDIYRSNVVGLYEGTMKQWSWILDEDYAESRKSDEPRFDSRWINLGFWTKSTRSYNEACDTLANQLADAAEFNEGDVVADVGCGYGESGMLWSRRMGGKVKISGVNISPEHVRDANHRVQGTKYESSLTFQVGNACDLPFEDDSLDKVTALECAFHFYTRIDFFKSAFEKLAPGGRIVTADIVQKPWTKKLYQYTFFRPIYRFIGEFFKCPYENHMDLEEYKQSLKDLGYVNIKVTNITRNVFPAFKEYFEKRVKMYRDGHPQLLEAAKLAGASKKEFELFEFFLRLVNGTYTAADYIICSADKPE